MNNRIYKFRAWDKIKKVMIYFDEDYYIQSDEHEGLVFPRGTPKHSDLEHFDFVLMQYKGFKVNDTEIYDGDILEFTDPDKNNKPCKTRYVVKWDDWKMLDSLQNGFNFVEVIGNIFEGEYDS